MRWLPRLLLYWLVACGLLVNLLGLALLIALFQLGPTATLVQVRDALAPLRPRVEALARQADRTRSLTGSESVQLQPALPALVWRPPVGTLPADLGYGRVLRVGPGQALAQPSDAARIARPGDIIEIEAGTYRGDAAIWRVNDLVIRGSGGFAHLDAEGALLDNQKGIWVIQGSNIRVEGIRFSGAAVPDRNGAGIRAEGDRLHVIGSVFDNNENGILSNPVTDGTMTIEFSEFFGNGHASGQAHQLYVNRSAQLVLRGNYFHNAQVGSNIKSRAQVNHLLYNRVVDGRDGRSSYLVDLSNGGRAWLVGNQLQQGPNAENFHLVAFAPEGGQTGPQELWLVHNTLVNDRHNGVFVRAFAPASIHLHNNLLLGRGRLIQGEARLAGNVQVLPRREAGVMDRGTLDYRPLARSPAAGAGERLTDGPLQAEFEYRHPLALHPRTPRSPPDAGALAAAD